MTLTGKDILDLKEQKSKAYETLLKAYSECLIGVPNDELENIMLKQEHIVNDNFAESQVYIVGYSSNQNIKLINILYVEKAFRTDGLASYVIENFQFNTKDAIVQIKVHKNLIQKLDHFYDRLGFLFLNSFDKPDGFSNQYKNYFWSKNPLEINYKNGAITATI